MSISPDLRAVCRISGMEGARALSQTVIVRNGRLP